MQIHTKIIFLICLIFITQNALATFSGGTGTITNPYIITNCLQLQDANIVTTIKHYALGSDINCYTETHLGGTLWNGGLGFSPIGNFNTGSFKGTFDGRGFAISNLYINRITNDVGLFGFVQKITIKNLNLL